MNGSLFVISQLLLYYLFNKYRVYPVSDSYVTDTVGVLCIE